MSCLNYLTRNQLQLIYRRYFRRRLPQPVPDTNSIIANPDSSAVGNVLTNDDVVGPG